MLKSLGLIIRKHRQSSKLSMSTLARAIGVSKQTIYWWEHNLRSPDYRHLVLLSNVLAVNVEDLVIYKMNDKM